MKSKTIEKTFNADEGQGLFECDCGCGQFVVVGEMRPPLVRATIIEFMCVNCSSAYRLDKPSTMTPASSPVVREAFH